MTITVHPYEQLPAEVLAAVSGVIEQATGSDGVEPLSEQFILGLRRSGLHWVAKYEGTICGYAASDGAAAELVVAPNYRRRGVGSRLLQQIPAEVPVWAHGYGTATEAFAAARGLQVTRRLLQMSRVAEPVAAPDIAPEQQLWVTDYPQAVRRLGHDKVDKQWLAVNNAAFDWHPEQGGWTPEMLDERRAVGWFDPAGVWLAFDTAGSRPRLVAFHWTKVHDAHTGEIYVVGVDPAAQGRGLGRIITEAGLHYLTVDRGVREVVLYVEADNFPAVATYKRQGFAVSREDVQLSRERGED